MKYSVGYSYSIHYSKTRDYLILCCQSVATDTISRCTVLLQSLLKYIVKSRGLGSANLCRFKQILGCIFTRNLITSGNILPYIARLL